MLRRERILLCQLIVESQGINKTKFLTRPPGALKLENWLSWHMYIYSFKKWKIRNWVKFFPKNWLIKLETFPKIYKVWRTTILHKVKSSHIIQNFPKNNIWIIDRKKNTFFSNLFGNRKHGKVENLKMIKWASNKVGIQANNIWEIIFFIS